MYIYRIIILIQITHYLDIREQEIFQYIQLNQLNKVFLILVKIVLPFL
jgi:hypothetical protein